MANDDVRHLRELEKEIEALKIVLAERDFELSTVREMGRIVFMDGVTIER